MNASRAITIALILCGEIGRAHAQAAPAGEVSGTAWEHTPQSAQGVVQGGTLALPASVAGSVYVGAWRDAPKPLPGARPVPVVIFLHGSSGLALKAIGEWQTWLAGLGVASFAPDSFALPQRITYKSPVSREVYERIHALRASEIPIAAQAVTQAAWADPARLVLAGTSEGATAVARHGGAPFAGRIIFSWSCEDNYFVQEHRSSFAQAQPVLNIISSTDPFFSPSNAWLGNAQARGHCGTALKDNRQSSIVLIPGAPHTLLNFPAARHAVAGFVADVLKP